MSKEQKYFEVSTSAFYFKSIRPALGVKVRMVKNNADLFTIGRVGLEGIICALPEEDCGNSHKDTQPRWRIKIEDDMTLWYPRASFEVTHE